MSDLDERNADWIKQVPGAQARDLAAHEEVVEALARAALARSVQSVVNDPVQFAKDCALILRRGSAGQKASLRARLRALTKYSPHQPRVPAGSAEGGRWAESGESSAGVGSMVGDVERAKEYRARLKELFPDAKVRLNDEQGELFGDYIYGEAYTSLQANARQSLEGLSEEDLEEWGYSGDVKMMDAIIKKAGVSSEDLVVYRGIQSRVDLKPIVGEVLYDRGYMSTSFSSEFAETWAGKDGWTLEIRLPKGTNALPTDLFKSAGDFFDDPSLSEGELILPRRTAVRVVSVDGRHVVAELSTEKSSRRLELERAKYSPSQPRGWQDKSIRRWRRVDARARSWEDRFRDAGRTALESDKREVLRLVKEAGEVARKQKATVNWQSLMFDIKQYLAFASREHWRSAFLPAMSGTVTQAAEDYALEFGLTMDLQALSSYYWFEDYTLTFSDPIRATTLDAISQVLLDGQAEGISVGQLQKRLGLLFEQWMTGDLTAEEFAWFRERMPAYRLELIVRTETMRAYNSGSFNTAKAWGAEFKEWIGTPDDRIRDTHMEAWRRYSEGGDPGPIPMDRPFVVGGQNLMYPGDPSAHIRETANCRCTWAVYQPEFAEEEQAAEGFGL